MVLYPRHRKPYRVHHLASLLITSAVVLACVFELGMIAGRGQNAPAPVAGSTLTPSAPSQTVVRSGYGFSLKADDSTFAVSGTQTVSGQAQAVPASQLDKDLPLTSVTVSARPGAVRGRLAAAELSVKVDPAAADLTAAEHAPVNAGKTPEQVAALLFPVNGGTQVSTRQLSSGADKLNGVAVQKTVYEFTGAEGGKSYALQWSGTVKGRAFSVELDGLTGSGAIPGEFAPLLDSLDISDGKAVLGASTTDSIFAAPAPAAGKLSLKYLSDALSPAVVQIFHTVCGILTIDGHELGSSNCVSFSGSGFLVTDSGYIATNGHVVVYTAKDALADLVASNKSVLQAYLKGMGLSQAQINATESDPAALAALIAKIYDMPDSALHFSSEGDLTLVALGDKEPDIKKLVRIKTAAQLASFKHDTAAIKQAQVIAYDYNAKDVFTAIADPKAGFSSSDVALIKINVNNAPVIPIETGQVVQNEDIVVMGFPGDANNPLTDNQQTDVTVTDGVVSSIREAAGGHGKLYQSDAAASHGNSGGPAVDDQGKAIGLMTYRYADTVNGDAPESYIRDIADFTKLASQNDVVINGRSSTQQEWEKGLELYSHDHYSAALKDFYKVRSAYPAQRLVGNYITSSKQAIADGQNVPDVPVSAVVVVLVVALAGLGATIVIMIRHHALHKVYRTSVPDADNHQPVYLARPHEEVVPPAQASPSATSSDRAPAKPAPGSKGGPERSA